MSVSFDTWAILFLPLASDPLVALDDKCLALSCFLMFVLALRLELTLACVVVARFAGIMGDFAWRPLMKQVGLAVGIMPPSATAATEGGQPVVEIGPIVVNTAKIAPNAPSLPIPLYGLRGSRMIVLVAYYALKRSTRVSKLSMDLGGSPPYQVNVSL